EYLWSSSPDAAVLRHQENRKWYGLVMQILPEKLGMEGNKEIDVLNVKCPNELIGSMRKRKGIRPAYHMNKEHWVSVVLHEFQNIQELAGLIEMSYHLTK